MKRCQDHTDTNKEHTCGATSWAVGCRLAGETELSLLHAPSQQEEELVPQAGGQTQEAFEDNAGHGTFAAVRPTAFRSHPELIKLTSRKKCPCQINYETNWWQQGPRSTGGEALERRALLGWSSPAKSITLCSSYSGKILLPHCLGTFSCYTAGKETTSGSHHGKLLVLGGAKVPQDRSLHGHSAA